MPLRFAKSEPNGGVTIIAAAPKEHLQEIFGPEWNDEQYRAHVLERNGLTEADVVELPDDWTPPDGDRTFRNAWTLSGAQITVDMPKARDIWRQKMREARAPLLQALDVEYMRADEAGDGAAKTRIAAEKQALRDVTADPAIEAAQTPDELKALWPSVLSGGGK
jgi:hypothetical protein